MPRHASGRRELRGQVALMLTSLGDGKDEIARQLHAVGVRGTPGSVRECALAVYLSAVVAADPRVQTVLVSRERVFLKLEGQWRYLGVPLTKPLRGFVADFDQHRYPAVVRPAVVPDRGASDVGV